MKLNYKDYEFSAHRSSRQPWIHFRIHKHSMHWHIVWGKLSIVIGAPDLELVDVCAVCDSSEIGEVSAGDEGWTVCQDCGSIEQGYKQVTIKEFENL